MKKNQEPTPVAASVLDLMEGLRCDAVRFGNAQEPKERKDAAENMILTWRKLHAKVLASRLKSADLSFVTELADELTAAATSEDKETRLTALNRFSEALERVANGVSALGTPFEPGAAWRPNTEPLPPEEKTIRLERVSTRTKETARSLAEALRVVLRVRREEGVPLYSTCANETQAAYASAAESHAMVSAKLPLPDLPLTSPWGEFRVQSNVPPEQVEARFAVSPPLPQRVDIIEGQTTPIRFAALHRNEHIASHEEGSDNADQ